MNLKGTWTLVALAALLAGFIFGWEKFVAGPAREPLRVLPGLEPQTISAIQVRVAGQPELLAERTNGGWHLTKPLVYPAQAQSIEALLAALGQVQPDRFISPRELIGQTSPDADFGFERPLATVMLFSGNSKKQVIIGSRTAPGDQVFVEVVGIPGVHIVSTNLLNAIPQSPGEWRDTALLDWKSLQYDRLLVNHGARTIELQLNSTNGQWRLVRQKARADSILINELLKRLQTVRVAQFISDNPQADLDAFGLQTPELEITFAKGTNVSATLHFGKGLTNETSLVYARRGGLDSVLAVPGENLKPWRASATEFYDRHLVSFQKVPDAIEVVGVDRFTVVHETNFVWRMTPQNLPVDTNYMTQFILMLARMQVEQFVKDVVIESALTNYGLANPPRQYVLKSGGATNSATVQLLFGAEQEGLVFAKRSDEDSVYAVKRADFDFLPAASWELRDRRVWHFTEEDVASVRIEQGGRTKEINRSGTNQWALAAGSVGSINTFAVEETVHRIGDLNAAFWTARGEFDRAAYGFTNPVHRLTFELRDGAKRQIEFGGTAPSQFPYAIVTLDGEPWLMEFPWATFQDILTYLSIPVREDL